MISLGVGGCRRGFWDAVDGMCITVIIPHRLFGVVWNFFLWCGCFWVVSVFIDMLGIGFRGKCFMNTCPLLGLGCGVFLSLFLCLHCVLGGLGVLDQGADSTLRDPEVQVLLLLLLFSFSYWDWVFEQTCVCYILFGRSLYIAAR